MRFGTLVRLWTIHGTFTVDGHPDPSGSLPISGWTVTCPSCQQENGLRLVVVAPLAVLWCPCQRAWSYPWLNHQRMVALVDPLCDGPMEEFLVDGGPDADWPPEILERFPGLDTLVDSLGATVRHSTVQPNGPTRQDTWGIRLPDGPADKDARKDLQRAAVAASIYHRDEHPDGKPDHIVMVPMSLRELAALQSLAYAATPALPTDHLFYSFATDLYRRGRDLASAEPAEARKTLAANSSGAEALMGMARWVDRVLFAAEAETVGDDVEETDQEAGDADGDVAEQRGQDEPDDVEGTPVHEPADQSTAKHTEAEPDDAETR